jgi:MFS family permease
MRWVVGSLPTRWFVLIGLVMGRIAFGFGFQAMPTAAPGVAKALALDAVAVGSLVGLFMLPGAVLAFPGGMIAQRIGERRVLGSAFAMMLAGTMLIVLANGVWQLGAGRLVTGTGAILITVVASKQVLDWFSGKELATAMGMFIAGFPVGVGLALFTLGPLATAEHWRWAFAATAVVCAVSWAASIFTHRTTATSVGMAAIGRVSLRDAGMIVLAAMVIATYNAAYLVMLGLLPLYLVSRGLSPAVAAGAMGAGVWVSILSIPLGGWVTDRVRRPNAIMVGGALFWAITMVLVIPTADSPGWLAVLLAFSSLLGAFPVSVMMSLSAEVVPPRGRSVGMGIFYTTFYVVAALAPAVAGMVLTATSEEAVVWLLAGGSLTSILWLTLFRAVQRHVVRRAGVGAEPSRATGR